MIHVKAQSASEVMNFFGPVIFYTSEERYLFFTNFIIGLCSIISYSQSRHGPGINWLCAISDLCSCDEVGLIPLAVVIIFLWTVNDLELSIVECYDQFYLTTFHPILYQFCVNKRKLSMIFVDELLLGSYWLDIDLYH